MIWDCDMNEIDTTLYIPELGCTYKQIYDRANTPGFNQYGTPLHACHGHIHNEHYWAYVKEHVHKLKEAGVWPFAV